MIDGHLQTQDLHSSAKSPSTIPLSIICTIVVVWFQQITSSLNYNFCFESTVKDLLEQQTWYDMIIPRKEKLQGRVSIMTVSWHLDTF